MLEAKPMIIVQIEPGFRRAEITDAYAAGVVAQPNRWVGLSLKNWIGQKTPHCDEYGQRAAGWQGFGVSCGPAVRLNRAGLRQAQAKCRLKPRGRIRPVSKLRPRISPAQNGGAHLPRQAVEGAATPVLFDRGEQVEQGHRLGFPGDSDTAVE